MAREVEVFCYRFVPAIFDVSFVLPETCLQCSSSFPIVNKSRTSLALYLVYTSFGFTRDDSIDLEGSSSHAMLFCISGIRAEYTRNVICQSTP